MGRNFTELKKELVTDEKLKKFGKKLFEEYANSDSEFSRSYFYKEYNITKSCFEKLMYFTMVEGSVSDDTIEKYKNKAIALQKAHVNTSARNTINRVRRVYTERQSREKPKTTEENIKSFVELYALNLETSKEDLAKATGYTVEEANIMIWRAITENIVCDETVKRIELRSINNSKPENREGIKEYFDGLWKVRNGNKRGVAF